uniref:Uncharacterized protein n=1 Tax=Takifugu rubripes TaxID=31033 RepID=A0A3B5K5H6_TAKRU
MQVRVGLWTAGLISSFILLSCVSVTSAMSLDLTELRNKVSEIKVNPRWNLWASGHFMGKKSVAENSFGKVPAIVRGISPLDYKKDMQTLLIQILKPQWKQAGDM